MSIKIHSFAPLPRDVSLEDLVPKDNFYRRLEASLDLSFVRELVGSRYANGGRPSVDPVVFFKLQLIMFFEDLRPERQLTGIVSDRLSLRWYLGYDLNDPLPDHSSLTRIRERYGLLTFRRFFERIVQECAKAGLVWGEELFFDATNDGRPDRTIVRHGYRRKSDYVVSPTDPDAALMQYKRSASRLGHHAHYVVDGEGACDPLGPGHPGRRHGEPTDARPPLEDHLPLGARVRRVTGDATYGTRENIAAIEKTGIRAYTALPEQGKRTSLFTIEDFLYDAEKDLYTCPQGETLRRQGYDRRGGYVSTP